MCLSLGLPQLVARTLAEYEEIAVRLATSPGKLSRLRRQLVVRRALVMNTGGVGGSSGGAGSGGVLEGGEGRGAGRRSTRSCRDSSTILFDVPQWMRCRNFSKGLSFVTLYSKHTKALTFENLCQVLRAAARHGARSAWRWGRLCCPLCICFRRR